MDYETFRNVVQEAADRRQVQGRLVPLPELRRECGDLERTTFDAYVLALHREGVIHLLSHVEPHKLTDEARRDCLLMPAAPLLYWLRWV